MTIRIASHFVSKPVLWGMPYVLIIYTPELRTFMQRLGRKNYWKTSNPYGKMWSTGKCISPVVVDLYMMGFLPMGPLMIQQWCKRFIRPMEDLTNSQMPLRIPRLVQILGMYFGIGGCYK